MVDASSVGFDFPFFKEAIAALVGVPTFAYSCYRYGRHVGSSADKKIIDGLRDDLVKAGGDTEKIKGRFAELERVVRDPRDFWIREPGHDTLTKHQASLQTSMPIICVVNFKGGVGKTTICANLAAH